MSGQSLKVPVAHTSGADGPFAPDRDAVQLTLFAKPGGGLLSKNIYLDASGELVADGSCCRMTDGWAVRQLVPTAKRLAEIVEGCGPNYAIALGALREDLADRVDVTAKASLAYRTNAVTRTAKNVAYRTGIAAWVMIDFDTKGMPADIAASIKQAGGMWNALLRAAPMLADASRVSRSSTSAGLHNVSTGLQIAGSGGQHHYILVQDGGDAERFLKALHDRAWLNGYGWHRLSKDGKLLDRSIIDASVWGGERLCFEGAPTIMPPLAQDSAARSPVAVEGIAIDSKQAVPPLDAGARRIVDDAKEASRRRHGKASAAAREIYENAETDRLVKTRSLTVATARRHVKARYEGVLTATFELVFDDLGSVTVGAVLANPEEYLDETLSDPIEGPEYGTGKAKVMRGEAGGLFVHSFAHGKATYDLRYDFATARSQIEALSAADFLERATKLIGVSYIDIDEYDQLKRLIAKLHGCGVRIVDGAIKQAKKEIEDARRRVISDEVPADGRMVRQCPADDAERLPIVRDIDQVLAAVESAERPMRDVLGNLVAVRETAPWEMHLLTSSGTNAGGAAAEEIKPPTEASLKKLDPTEVGMLIELYIEYRSASEKKANYAAALPKPFVDAFMKYSDSNLPIVRAINTMPMIALSGDIISGTELDRASGLLHRIAPELLACVDDSEPTDEDGKAAIELLRDWLIDVAFQDINDFYKVILALLTLIQGRILKARPAFIITAPEAKGGKTTLAHMLTLAATGRMASATAWPAREEERAKALFAHFRRSPTVLIYDNIPRGAAIESAAVEAALTSPTMTDRVLGVSESEVVPTTAVLILTGNQLTAKGDMSSRILRIQLKVDRPNPESRHFKHPDPLEWTKRRRLDLMRAAYILLRLGAVRRPAGLEAKTRFKDWYLSAGWPVEFAANLAGDRIDCDDMFRATERDDEDRSDLEEAIMLIWSLWGIKSFTAQDISDPNHAERQKATGNTLNSLISEYETDPRAASLLELVGTIGNKKDKERLDARQVGKILKSHMLGRPVRLENGPEGRPAIITLRNEKYHAACKYHITVSS